ncbi:MAG: HAMP domain-containing protein [Candidatus Latescibacteria bacterium]|jgi:methyl-accepting chemotaxis protein|nr:HAMP domain-containing protein [Candidatus Latescibacterota bacterium]MBT5832018.1 HAMP domain-containing protein [Candidatus Latescibacterota bacterium]
MDNLKIRLVIVSISMMALAMILGIFGPNLARTAMGEELQWWQLVLGGVVFIGLCGTILFNMLEKALSSIINLTDHFMRMQMGDLAPRLPLEGPEEMQLLAKTFNETMSELETQIRDINEEKQAAERGRQFVVEQLEASQTFKALADQLPMGLICADNQLNITYQNDTSETGFIQLSEYLTWNADALVGQSISQLFPDQGAAEAMLASPENMPYEATYDIGPYKIHLQASAIVSEEDEYIGPVVLWEVLGLESNKVDDSLPDLDESILEEMVEEVGLMDEDLSLEPELHDEPVEFENVMSESGFEPIDTESDLRDTPVSERDVHPSQEHQQALAQGLVNADRQLTRSTTLVGRSVSLLSERLVTIMSMVEALCNEGDNLHHSQEEMRQRTQNVAYLVTERSESLWELTQEMSGLAERTNASSVLIKRLKKNQENTEHVTQTIAHFSDTIDNLVLQARLEVTRVGDTGEGMKIVVDEMRKIGREAVRVHKEVKKQMDSFATETEDALALLEEDKREVRSSNRIARRAEGALERIEKDLSEVEERTHLLTEMTSGQSEISTHVADQLGELTELINVTQRVANEQARMVSNILTDADAHISESNNSFEM